VPDFRIDDPLNDPDPELSGADLVVIGAAFAKRAKETFDHDLRNVFEEAAAQLAEAGAARMP
jgi:hypothetical protein